MDLSSGKKLNWKRRAGITAFSTFLVIASLFLLDRTLSGEANGPGLWTGDIHGALNSQRLTDPFALIHLNHGIGLFLVLSALFRGTATENRFEAALAIEAIWEVMENTSFSIENFRQVGMRQEDLWRQCA